MIDADKQEELRRKIYGDNVTLKESAEKFFPLISHDLFTNMIHICDFGCGDGNITQWWVDQAPFNKDQPYVNHTKVFGIDLLSKNTDKFDFTQGDILNMPYKDDEFNAGWCHHTLQQINDPIAGLLEMRRVMTSHSLLYVVVPQTLDTEFGRLKTKFDQFDRTFYTLPILIKQLAMTGWNCRKGYFNKIFNNRNIYAVVSPKQDWVEPNDPYELTMVDLMDREVLPESTDKMIKDRGYFDETALMLRWMDGAITDYNTRV